MAEDEFFCVAQKAFIDKDGEILILNDPKIGVDFPGGKVQEGETDFNESLKREVREETGLEIEIGKPFDRWYFEFKKEHRNFGKRVVLIGFRCKYVSGDVVLSDEHDGYKWVGRNEFREFDNGSGHFRALEKYFEGS
jgi:8-oxo-dGTP diphosphatase